MGGRCLNIMRDVCMDLKPHFKVYNLVSVHFGHICRTQRSVHNPEKGFGVKLMSAVSLELNLTRT